MTVKTRKKRLPPHAKPERNKQVLALRRAGLTLAAIGARHGITRERVRQIVRREEARQ